MLNEDEYKIRGLREKDGESVMLYVEAKRSGLCVAKMLVKAGTGDDVRTAANNLMQLWLMGCVPPLHYANDRWLPVSPTGLLDAGDPLLTTLNAEEEL
jgi:hypothetical protein